MADKNEMYNLIDYIRWRGDLSFKVSPFNNVDNVILCQLSYIDFGPVLREGNPKGITLADAFHQISEKGTFRLLTAIGGDVTLAREAAASERFGSLLLTYYTDILDNDTMQFAAVHFELDRKTSYVAFRGTDNSIIGWKEDFMMSFRSVPAQESAAYYLPLTMHRGRKYYLGGHSKGGNLAVYAASRLSPALRRRILRIYANDSPGFSAEVYDMDPLLSLRPLITKLTPSYGIIGRLFRLEADKELIVRSTAGGLLQHDLMTWKVFGTKFDCAEEFDAGSDVLHKAFTSWIKNADEEGRKAFVDWLFSSLSAGGALKIDDLGMKDVPDVLKSIFSPSPEAKDVAFSLPVSVLAEAGKQFQESLGEHLGMLRTQIARLKKTDKDKK